MRNVTKDNLTDAFESYFGPDTDPRFREVMLSLAKHLHMFAKDSRERGSPRTQSQRT